MRVTTIEELGEDNVRAAFMASADKHFGRKVPRKLRRFLKTVPLEDFIEAMFMMTGALSFNLEIGDEVVVFANAAAPTAGSC